MNLEAAPQSEPAVRELVTLIRASSEFRNMTTLADAARQAESADIQDFPARLRALISLMQEEVRRQTTQATTILIISQDKAMVLELLPALEARGTPVVITQNTTEARQVIASQTIGVCIIDLVLPKEDGRNFIAELRSKPETAVLMILAIGPHLNPGGTEKRLFSEADIFFEKPIHIPDVVSFLDMTRKRGPVKGREARRDPTTGTPNRAACIEAYSQIQKTCTDHDPISFALFGIHRFNTLVRNGGPVARENLIRQVASLLSSSFRASDVVARWGVSEFAVIMPGEDHFGATKAIEKVLPILNSQTITTTSGKTLPITLCAGLTLVNNQSPLDEAAAMAECHLYMAFHHAWQHPRKNWLVSDAIQTSRRNETIALFLNDPTMSKVLQQVLERETFKIESFASKTMLRSALAVKSFSLLITDDTFPANEGFEILTLARALPDDKRLRTLMIVSNESNTERALDLGAHDFAVKPFSVPRILSQVRRLLWQREESRTHARMTIMVVDHEIPQLLIAGTALHQLGECRVLLAHGIQDAIHRLAQSHPNYMIVDMNMPGVSGEEFINALPNQDWLKDIEIITASTQTATQARPKTSRKIAGAISRPYQPVKFIKEIRGLITMLQDDSLTLPPVDSAPLEAEVRRILTQQAIR